MGGGSLRKIRDSGDRDDLRELGRRGDFSKLRPLRRSWSMVVSTEKTQNRLREI